MPAALPSTQSDRDWFSVPGAAQWLSDEHHTVGPRTIYAAIRDGKLKAAPINERGDLRIHRSWLLDWLERRAER
jgi:hypothetical protein